MEKLIQIFQIDKTHIKYLIVIALLILVSANIVSFMNAGDLEDVEEYSTLTVLNVTSLENMRDKITAAQSGRQLYFISNDKSYINPYKYLSGNIDTLYSKLRNSTKENLNIQKSLDTLSVNISKRFEIMNRGIELQSENGPENKTVRTLMSEGEELYDKIMNSITYMQNEEYRFLNSKIKVTNSKSAFTKYLMIIGSTFSILILIFSFIASVKIYSNRNYDKIPGRMSQDELETIVRERTAEISQINNRLYKELKKQVETDAVLRQREHDYRILFEQAHDAIIIFEPESEIILEVNHRACEVYQIPHKHFIGISLKSLSKNVHKGEMHLSQTLKNGYKLNFQTVHYRKDGTEMLMEINASVINYKGKTAILSINRDVTERILSLIPLPGSEQ